MRRAFVGSALGVVAIAAGGNLHGQVATTAVRPEQGDVQRVVAKGLEGSETFRELAARLDSSDVVVYVRFARCAGVVPACLMLASSTSGSRRLLVNLDRFGKSENELVGLLAHELQHANEVASAPEVRDAASFQKFFERCGWKGSDGFETAHAKEITRKVASEMIGRRRGES
jgi:hypothetical protein